MRFEIDEDNRILVQRLERVVRDDRVSHAYILEGDHRIDKRAGGFLAVFVVVLIAVAIVGRLLRKVFHFAGFGIPDHLLGVAVSAAKTLLILGLLFSAFESLNKDHTLAEEKTLDRSVCYRPMIRLADSLFPLLEWAKEQVSIDEQELWSDNSPER